MVAERAPQLVAEIGIGTLTGAQILISDGDDGHCQNRDDAIAALSGDSAIPVSTGRTDRHRLNRGGDRQANGASLHDRLSRMKHDEQTRTFIAARLSAGKTKKDAIRILRRYLARRVYQLRAQRPTPTSPPAATSTPAFTWTAAAPSRAGHRPAHNPRIRGNPALYPETPRYSDKKLGTARRKTRPPDPRNTFQLAAQEPLG